MRRLRAFLFVSLTAISVASPALAQTKDNTAAAKKLFDEGVELEKSNDYAGALQRYKDAEQIAITPGLEFHKGYCFEQLGKLVAAADAYDQADHLAQAQNRKDVQSAVKARLDPLRPRIPSLTVRLVTNAADAEVFLDTVTQLPNKELHGQKAFRVDPGEHVINAHASGYKNYVKRVQVVEGQQLAVDVTFERDATAPPPPPPPPIDNGEPPPDLTVRRSLVPPIATTAGAVALAGLGVVFFVVAGNKQQNALDKCGMDLTCDPSGDRTATRAFDALALGSWIGAAALATTAIVLWTRTGPTRAGQAAEGATLSAQGSRLLLEGSF